MKDKVLIVGKLGYHENNITKWILKELSSYYKVARIGGDTDFFIKENIDKLIPNYFESLKVSLKDFKAVLFLDFWNMSMPLWLYKKTYENPDCKFIGLFHGSVLMENDVANRILGSKEYEKYLLKCFDKILVPKQFIKDSYFLYEDNVLTCLFPLEEQFLKPRKDSKPAKRVVFAHRWNEDKGKDEFLCFIKYCKSIKALKDLEFFITDSKPKNFYMEKVYFVERLDKKGLKLLCSKGGYIWSSAKSETIGYTIYDCINYGLSPILSRIPAYESFPDRYTYSIFEEAAEIILKERVISNIEWYNLYPGKNTIVNEIRSMLQ